jgi:hypothetical protein
LYSDKRLVLLQETPITQKILDRIERSALSILEQKPILFLALTVGCVHPEIFWLARHYLGVHAMHSLSSMGKDTPKFPREDA